MEGKVARSPHFHGRKMAERTGFEPVKRVRQRTQPIRESVRKNVRTVDVSVHQIQYNSFMVEVG